jgi:hypothetical protein
MSFISSILSSVWASSRGIPEWVPHDHDMLHRNVPLGTGVETRSGMRARQAYRHAWRGAYAPYPAYSPAAAFYPPAPFNPFARYTPYRASFFAPQAYASYGMLTGGFAPWSQRGWYGRSCWS